MTATLCQLIHGDPGVGKTWFANTSPVPRLILDAEGGSRVPWRMCQGKAIRQTVVHWDPMREAPPTWDGWDACWVSVQSFPILTQVYQWLNTGNHPFRSCTIDSLTEVQKRCRDSLTGSEALRTQDWGDLLIKMENICRYYRDLVFNPIKALEVMTFIAISDPRSGTAKPHIQGGLSISLPGLVDLEGYLYNEATAEGLTERKLLITPYTSLKGSYQAKDRTHLLTQYYGAVITNPDIENMLAVLNTEGDSNG